jgi:predicted nucleotidyltransferase
MNLSDKEDLRWLSQLVGDIRSAGPDHDPMMVGAMARDLLLHYGRGVPVQRATTDVDLAFAVANWDEFSALRDALLTSEWFTATRAEHKLRHREALEIDLIPFGGVEDAAGQVVWPVNESLIRVLGYQEARATSLEVLLPEGQRISTVSLPMLAAIKVIAWADRHTSQPRKDASDLLLVLKNYLHEKNAARLYGEAAHLLEETDFDYESAGAWLAGNDAAASIARTSSDSVRLLDVLRDILYIETDANGQLRLIGESGLEPDSAIRLLRSFRDGLFAEHSDAHP